MTDVVMPQLGLTMETGLLLSWLVDDGTRVAEGDPIAEIATDKIDHELVAPADGVLGNLHAVSDSEELPVGTVLATLAP